MWHVFLHVLLVILVLGGCAKVEDVPQRQTEYIEVPYTGQVPSQTIQDLEQQYPPGFWEDQANAQIGEKWTIAVKEFSSTSRPELGRSLADMVTSALINSGQVDVVEREQIGALLSELELSQTGLTATPSGYDTGQMQTVDYVVTGNVSQVGAKQRIEAKLLDVLSGQIIASESLLVDQVNVAAANALSGMILGKLRQRGEGNL